MYYLSILLKRYVRHILLFVFLFFFSVCVFAEEPSNKIELSQGVYRIEGTCKSMMWNLIDVTNTCRNFAGIITDLPNRPKFFFFRTDGASWYFQGEGAPRYNADGSTATFPIVTLVDGSKKRAFDLPGECVINEKTQPTISCSIRSKKGYKLYKVIFSGKKPWIFSSDLLWK